MSESTLQTIGNRRIHLEAMRILAAFFVIFNHTNEYGFFLFSTKTMGSIPFWVYLFISVFCKFAVPLFLAISGAVLLNREISLKALWTKRILKVCVTLFAVTCIHHILDWMFCDGELNFLDILESLYAGYLGSSNIGYIHLWYLYLHIALLISLPFLQSMVKHLDNKYFYYLLGIALCSSILYPLIDVVGKYLDVRMYTDWIPDWVISQAVLYASLGYFLEHRVDVRLQKKALPWLWLANLIGIAASCILTYWRARETGILNESESQSYHFSFVLLNCMTLFVTFKCAFHDISVPQWLQKGILSLGKCTFGIYLFHLLIFRFVIPEWFWQFLVDKGINSMLASFIECSLVMIVGYLVTSMIMKIPYLKTIVGG